MVESTFGAAVAALTSRENQDFDLGATAVAGLSIYACDVQPMMFCLPNNGNYPAKDNIGKMIKLRAGGPNAAWAPGDVGFLDPREVFVNETGPCAGLKDAPCPSQVTAGSNQIVSEPRRFSALLWLGQFRVL